MREKTYPWSVYRWEYGQNCSKPQTLNIGADHGIIFQNMTSSEDRRACGMVYLIVTQYSLSYILSSFSLAQYFNGKNYTATHSLGRLHCAKKLSIYFSFCFPDW